MGWSCGRVALKVFGLLGGGKCLLANFVRCCVFLQGFGKSQVFRFWMYGVRVC